MTLDEIDKSGLIREAYSIEGITEGECRTIFLDWALKLPAQLDAGDAISALIAVYDAANPGHPMTSVLRAGLETPARPARRGGYRGRERG